MDEDAANLIQLLWGELPLGKEESLDASSRL